eukprot:TRINITY_DN20458_c0_g1_i1.p2 TRINITY_DN20458_c0_g1~~TRINITY_DN20458_c0_g1_i1.p2  ORF type:complete len:337 (+),score=124.21 TRINITY_DN20458_c0_g1_i1:49-1011(+)
MQRGALLSLPGIDHNGPREYECRAEGDDDAGRWAGAGRSHQGAPATQDIDTASLDLTAAFAKFLDTAHHTAPAQPHASTTTSLLAAALDPEAVAAAARGVAAPVSVPPSTAPPPSRTTAPADAADDAKLPQLLALEARVAELETTIGWMPRRLDRALQRSVTKQLAVIERRFASLEDSNTLKDVSVFADQAAKSAEGIVRKKAAYAKLESSSIVAKVSIVHNALKAIESVADDLPQIHERLAKVKQIVDNAMSPAELDELLGSSDALLKADSEAVAKAEKDMSALAGALPKALDKSVQGFEGMARDMAALQARVQALGLA